MDEIKTSFSPEQERILHEVVHGEKVHWFDRHENLYGTLFCFGLIHTFIGFSGMMATGHVRFLMAWEYYGIRYFLAHVRFTW
jgi:hypothetical protein